MKSLKISVKEFKAELIGTMLIILFGTGADAMNILFNLGGYISITFAWGIGVFLGILSSAKISGAHLNPAISIALAITKRFSWRKVPLFIIAQFLGAMIGAGIVYYFYSAKLVQVDPTLSHTAGIFTTFSAVSAYIPSIMAEIIATAILLFGILIISHFIPTEHTGIFTACSVAFLVVGIGMSFGGMHGYAMNPARDFGPRLIVTLLGFKHNGLTDGTLTWTHGIIGPLIGGPIGIWLYDFTLGKSKMV